MGYIRSPGALLREQPRELMMNGIETGEITSIVSREAAAGALAQGGAEGGTLGSLPHVCEP